MEELIVYQTIHGTSMQYAESLASKLKLEAVNSKDFKEPAHHYHLIYIGGLYAGGVIGLKSTLKKVTPELLTHLTVASVGLSSDVNPIDIANREKSILPLIPEQLHHRLTLYHLRGNIDYTKLSRVHRLMMWFVKRQAERSQANDEETKLLIETYGKQTHLYNDRYLEPVMQEILNKRE